MNEASERFEQLLQKEQDKLNEDIKDIFESDLGEAFTYQINLRN
ncbi:hypothetical protein RE628_07505 [Paenibacillus sp. D2_2]|nr:hypothetical protein [Paenibacillus sp. D2_2]WMT42241.1 hypothetical protein RE628_07505 [Paenibacillus sp. D2_2]